MVGPRPDEAPTLVLLHEGLGSAGMWGDFPERLAAATGFGVFAYSRVGYGHSSPASLPRALDFMHVEAREILPRVLDAIGFRQGVLVGHSDGASIAAIYAGTRAGPSRARARADGAALHRRGRDDGGDPEIRQAFDTTEVRQRFARWHADADATVRGWTDVWLNNDVSSWDLTEELAYIRVPILIIQGEHDHYGTVRQIEIAQEECYCPVEVLMMPDISTSRTARRPRQRSKPIADFCAPAFCASMRALAPWGRLAAPAVPTGLNVGLACTIPHEL